MRTWASWPHPRSGTTPTWPGCARTSRTSATPTSGPAGQPCCATWSPGRTSSAPRTRASCGRTPRGRTSSASSRTSAVVELEVDREAVVPVAGARDLDDAAVGHGTAGVAQHRVTLVDLEDRGLVGARAVGADGVLDLGRAQAPRAERLVETGRGAVLEEAGQQDLVEVGVLDADDGLVGAAQAAPVENGVTGRDVERPRDAGAGLLHAGEERLRLGQHPASADLLGERGEPAGGPGWLGDERAAAGDPLEEALGDEGVESLAYGHPRDTEAGH